MQRHVMISTLLGFALAGSTTASAEQESLTEDNPQTLGYGTSGIAEEVTDPDLGSVSTFGGEVPADYEPGRAKVSDSDPRGIGGGPGDAQTMGYGTDGIAEEVSDPDLGSVSNFGGEVPADYEPGRAKVSDSDPRGIGGGPGDAQTMGYGTSGIAEEVGDPGPGSTSSFGTPD